MESNMITFERAIKLLKENIFVLEPVKIPVIKSTSHILAEDIFSPINLPSFTNSAMDGYAVRIDDTCYKTEDKNIFAVFKLRRNKIKAGDSKRIVLKPGEAIKIFTGSPLPVNTDTVIIKEITEEREGFLFVKEKFGIGKNIRYEGEEIKKGDKILEKGFYFTPPAIGLLSTLGIKEVRVIRKPKVYVIITGSEIVLPGKKLKYGKIYDANSFSLFSALKMAGVQDIKIKRVRDDFLYIKKVFNQSLGFADIIIFTGGISVGEYDFVRELFKKENVEKVFYKVLQKPGKPMFFGKKGKKLVFALPGNPASVLVCFYEYVYPALRKMMGFKEIFLKEEKKILLKDIKKKPERLWFLKGRIIKNGVIPLDFQESHMLSSFARADCLIVAPKNRKLLKKGEKVKVHLLPF